MVAPGRPSSAAIPGGRHWAACGGPTLAIWDLATGQRAAVWHGTGYGSSLALTPEGRIMLGDLSGSVVFLDLVL